MGFKLLTSCLGFFVSIFIWDIGLWFSIIMMSLSGFGMNVSVIPVS